MCIRDRLHTEIDGVKIEANFDNFMDWLRQAALDEVYLDVAQESEENICLLYTSVWMQKN